MSEKALELIPYNPVEAANNPGGIPLSVLNDSNQTGGAPAPKPTPSAPTYVPPVDQTPLKIYLTTTDGSSVEFFEDSKSKGIGANITVIHNPSTAFGSIR